MLEASHHYAGYYGDTNLAAWRELSAKDKAANVIRLYCLVRQESPSEVADIGCGDGAVIQELGRQGFGHSYVGFEISESGLSYARQRQYAKPSRFELFDGRHLPVEDKSFDLAILSHVLEHVEEPRTLLREAARVSRLVFVEVPLELHLRTPHDFHWSDVGHINLFNPLLLRHLVQSTGLHVLAERVTCPHPAVFTFRYPGWMGILRWAIKAVFLRLSPALACKMLTYHGCLIARSPAGQGLVLR